MRDHNGSKSHLRNRNIKIIQKYLYFLACPPALKNKKAPSYLYLCSITDPEKMPKHPHLQ